MITHKPNIIRDKADGRNVINFGQSCCRTRAAGGFHHMPSQLCCWRNVGSAASEYSFSRVHHDTRCRLAALNWTSGLFLTSWNDSFTARAARLVLDEQQKCFQPKDVFMSTFTFNTEPHVCSASLLMGQMSVHVVWWVLSEQCLLCHKWVMYSPTIWHLSSEWGQMLNRQNKSSKSKSVG